MVETSRESLLLQGANNEEATPCAVPACVTNLDTSLVKRGQTSWTVELLITSTERREAYATLLQQVFGGQPRLSWTVFWAVSFKVPSIVKCIT